jgi:uncharacterized membrane protein (UPF0127 family)
VSLRLAAALAAAGVLAACGAAPKTSPAPAPVKPAADAGPRIEMPSGAVYAIELALTPEQQEQGLMFRESLPEKTGMLFQFAETAPHHFWMKNTMIPLDMIWMDEAGTVVFISADTPPCKADPCATYGPDFPAKSVLEIAGGKAAKEGVKVGSVLKLAGLAP